MNATFWASLILYNFSKVDGSSSKVHIEDHFLIYIVPIKFLSSALTDLRVEISRQTHANTYTCICWYRYFFTIMRFTSLNLQKCIKSIRFHIQTYDCSNILSSNNRNDEAIEQVNGWRYFCDELQSKQQRTSKAKRMLRLIVRVMIIVIIEKLFIRFQRHYYHQ